MNKNMKMGYYLTRPINLEILAILVIAISFMAIRSHKPAQVPVLAVLREQQVLANRCTPRDRLLLVPYARWLAQIDATACPSDFFQAWEKYVCDVGVLSAIDHAEAAKTMASIGAAVITGNPASFPLTSPRHPEQVQVARNTAAADWENVKHVALRYGIKVAPIQYSESYVLGLWIV
jgi:hypothetical protein